MEEKEKAGEAITPGAEQKAAEKPKKPSIIRPPEYEVSSSPHQHSGDSVSAIMWTVFAALLPAAAVGVYYFGFPALKVLVASVLGCMAVEAAYQKLTGQEIADHLGVSRNTVVRDLAMVRAWLLQALDENRGERDA